MNGKPEKWCGQCGGTGVRAGGTTCPCLTRTTPILKPVKCRACGGRYSPQPDGTILNHGSIGWSCNGKKVTTR